MNKYIILLKNTSFIMIGGALSKVISFLMLPLYTLWLSPEEYGISDVVQVYSTLLLGTVTLSIAESIFIFPKGVSKNEQKQYFSSSLSFTILLLVFVAGIFKIIEIYFTCNNINNTFSLYIWYIYWMIVSIYAQNFFQQFTSAINWMKVYSTTGIVVSLSVALLSIILIPKYGIRGYMISIIGSHFFAAIYTILTAKLYSYFSCNSITFPTYRKMLAYSIPLIPNGIMWWLISSLNRPLLENAVGLSAIGMYAVANKIPSLIIMIYEFFGKSWQIAVCEEYKSIDFSAFFNRILKYLVLGLTLLSCFLTIFAEPIISLLTTSQYLPSAKYIPYLCLCVLFSCISGFIGSLFAVHKQSKYFFYSSLWGGCTALFANIILIPIMGVMGAILASIVSYVVMMVFRLFMAKQYVEFFGIPYYIFLIAIYVSVVLICTVSSNILINLLYTVTIYVICLLSFKDMRNDLIIVLSNLKKIR